MKLGDSIRVNETCREPNYIGLTGVYVDYYDGDEPEYTIDLDVPYSEEPGIDVVWLGLHLSEMDIVIE